MQQSIDFDKILHQKENNKFSQEILEDNSERLSNQCRTVLDLLKLGNRLTVRSAMIFHNIGDLRRRIKDLRDAGIDIKSKMIGKGFKEYYL